MRAVASTVWGLVLSILVCVGLTLGCAPDDVGYGNQPAASDTDETEPSDDPLPQDTATATEPPGVCHGECTPQPQLPFNGRIHLIWLGSAASVPDCPVEAPLQGFEGYVVSMADMQDPPPSPRDGASLWVRECLISTDSDPCTAGTTCAPLPAVDYQLCLSRENAGPCPADHYPQQIVAQEWAASPVEPVTLCCAGNAPPP
jgi:hypothetical protein